MNLTEGGGKKDIKSLVTEVFNKPSECAFDKEQGPVCSPKNIVVKMAEFVESKTNKKMDIKKPHVIVGTMKEMMNCNSESCVIKRPEFVQFAKIAKIDTILDEFFKPSGPATHFGLLSNYNIDEVLDQLEEKFQGFLHIPSLQRLHHHHDLLC